MPARIRFIAADGLTAIETLNLGNVDSPSTSADTSFYVENIGDKAAEEVTVTLLPVGTNDGDDYARIAAENGGVAGAYTASPVSIGTLAVLARVRVWTRIEMPTGVVADGNPRRYTLEAGFYTL